MDQGLKNRFLTSFGMTFYFKGVWGKEAVALPPLPFLSIYTNACHSE